jgi:hypothetical protein
VGGTGDPSKREAGVGCGGEQAARKSKVKMRIRFIESPYPIEDRKMKKFPLPLRQRELFVRSDYGVLVGVGVSDGTSTVTVGVADAASVVLVTVGVAEGAAVVAVGVADAAAGAPEALKMMGAVHNARSPVAGPVARTVRMNFTLLPANGVRSISALYTPPSYFSTNAQKVWMDELPEME